MYAVKLEMFEGPLDLLLHLVDKNHLNITEISLASICGEYRAYLDRLQDMNLEIESSFITVFASLLEIKSKTLLPPPPKIQGEEEEPEPEHELVVRLREYKLIRAAAGELLALKEKADNAYPRPMETPGPAEEVEFLTRMKGDDLLNAYLSVMRKWEETQNPPSIQMVKEQISFPFIMGLVLRKIRRKAETYFHELFDSPPDKLRFIVVFLAVLEMARRSKVRLHQEENGGISIINCRIAGNSAVRADDQLLAG